MAAMGTMPVKRLGIECASLPLMPGDPLRRGFLACVFPWEYFTLMSHVASLIMVVRPPALRRPTGILDPSVVAAASRAAWSWTAMICRA